MVKWWIEKEIQFSTNETEFNKNMLDVYGKLLKLYQEFIEEQRRNLDEDFGYWDKFKDYVDNNSSIIVDSEEFKEAMKLIIEDENDFENKVRESID